MAYILRGATLPKGLVCLVVWECSVTCTQKIFPFFHIRMVAVFAADSFYIWMVSVVAADSFYIWMVAVVAADSFYIWMAAVDAADPFYIWMAALVAGDPFYIWMVSVVAPGPLQVIICTILSIIYPFNSCNLNFRQNILTSIPLSTLQLHIS